MVSDFEDSEPTEKGYRCQYCNEAFEKPIELARHVGQYHKKAAKKSPEKEEGVAPGAVPGAAPTRIPAQPSALDLSEKALEFAEHLEATAPGLAPKLRRQILMAYDDDPNLSKDRHALENFLDDFGFRRRQISQVTRALFGSSSGYQQQGQVIGYAQTPQGVQPITIMAPPGYGPGYGGERGVDRDNRPIFLGGERHDDRALEQRFEHMEQNIERRFEKMMEAMSRGREAQGPSIRRISRPMLDEKGKMILSEHGEPIAEIVEEPYEHSLLDRDTGLTTTLLNALINQPKLAPPPPVDTESIMLRARESLREDSERQAREHRDEMARLREGMTSLQHKLELDTTKRETIDEVMSVVSPQLKELQESKGISDTQMRMKHQKEIVSDMGETAREFFTGLREDIRMSQSQGIISQLAMLEQQMGYEAGALVLPYMQRIGGTSKESPSIPEYRKRSAVDALKRWAE